MSQLVSLNAGSYILYANNASLEATTKVWGAFRCTGLTLKNAVNDGGYVWLDGAAKADHSAFKFGMLWAGPFGQPAIYGSDGGIVPLSNHTGAAISTLDNVTMYEVGYTVMDNAALGGSVVSRFTVYPAGGLFGGSPIASWDVTAPSTVGTTSGCGCRFLGGFPSGFATVAGIYDWAKIGNTSGLSYEDSQLEEGSGSSVSPSGTITGSFSWLGGASDPDHGVVTLTPSSILLGATSVATVDWQDVSSASLVPQPTTAWSIVSDSLAATVNASTGVVTGVAAGSATVRATAGIVTATAEITVVNPYTFTGTIT